MTQQMSQADYMLLVANPTLAKIQTALMASQPDAANIDAFIINLLSAPKVAAARAPSIELLHFNDVYGTRKLYEAFL